MYRNIYFRQPKANNGADAVSMQNCTNIWVDHCTFESLNQEKDYEDGSCDITHASSAVTVSWCKFIKTQKSCLVGHSNSASADKAITVTFHHNWFNESSSRHTRVRFGKAHVFNNYFDGCTTYGVGSAYGAMVLVEDNLFDGVRLPIDICTYPAKASGSSWVSNLTGSVAGYVFARGDVFLNRPDNATDPYPFTNVAYTAYGGSATSTPYTYDDFIPSYNYTVDVAADLSTIVPASAGAGKLSGFSSAPVAVDNGGIDTPDAGDDDDETPEGDDDDEEDDPAPVAGEKSWSSSWFQSAGSLSSTYTSDGLTFTPVSSYSQKNKTTDGVKYYYCQTDGKFSFAVTGNGTLTISGSSSGSSKRTIILTKNGADTTQTQVLSGSTTEEISFEVEASDGDVIGFYPQGQNKINVFTITWTPAS